MISVMHFRVLLFKFLIISASFLIGLFFVLPAAFERKKLN